MRAARRRDSQPAVLLRRAVHSLELRYRVDARPLSDMQKTADLTFPRAKVAVFVDGCFWYGCPTHAASPKYNPEFWAAKAAGNKTSDKDIDQRLRGGEDPFTIPGAVPQTHPDHQRGSLRANGRCRARH
ncbi:very short patch repair endonuclease [Streptomyces sp. NPDC056159]|uniref:very short patch repair endonuclease n=1 Tax=Streptomyces sp. NPDC056159 TaxID=3155537 RepID=UPI0034201067